MRLATASTDAHCPRHAPGPLLEPALSHPVCTLMALMVVRMAFAETALIIRQPIPAESECLATIFRRLDYLNGLKRFRMGAIPPYLAIQEGASIKCSARLDATSCCSRRATHYMTCLIVSEARSERGSRSITMAESDFSMPSIFGYGFLLSSAIPPRRRDGMETSQVPRVDLHACMGSQTPRSPTALTKLDGQCCLRHMGKPRHSELQIFRCSLALPTRASTDASPDPSRDPMHGSRARKSGSLHLPFTGLSPAIHARVRLAHPIWIPFGDCVPGSSFTIDVGDQHVSGSAGEWSPVIRECPAGPTVLGRSEARLAPASRCRAIGRRHA